MRFFNLKPVGSLRKRKLPRLRKSRFIFRTLNIIFWLLLGTFILHFIYIFFGKVFFPPITFTQFNDIITNIGNDKYDFRRDYVSYDEISIYAKLAVLASEDNLFVQHDGFDEKELLRAIEYNKLHPKSLKGASTISQQTAKNVFLWQKKSWFRKGLEAYFTAMIEKYWGKKRILEVYLNVIEMGVGIYGIEAAAQYYYHKPAKKLTLEEAVGIAVALPNPKKYHPMHINEKQEEEIQRVYDNVDILISYPEVIEVLR